MRMLSILLFSWMMAGCSKGALDPSHNMIQVAELTEVLHVPDGFIAAAPDLLPNTVRVKRTDAFEATALLDKICRMNKVRDWKIQRVRIYPMDRADWTEAASLPELERDCS